MATEDGDAGRAQGTAARVQVGRTEGPKGWMVEFGGSATVALRDDWPELIAKLAEPTSCRHALVVECDELAVDAAEVSEKLVAFELQAPTTDRVDA